MTTNKPEVKIYEPSEKGATIMRKASFRNTGPDRYVRLSDYEALQAEREKLRKGLDAVQELIDSSYGVAGLHLNGDIAPWSDLLEGGRFEEWLSEFDAALEKGKGARGGGSNARV